MPMRRPPGLPILLAAIGGLVLAPLSPSRANVFSADGSDPRRYVADGDPLWRVLLPVGSVSSEFTLRMTEGIGGVAQGMGTAFMVSPCYAMTSYHVLFGRRNLALDPMVAYPVTLRFGLGPKGRPMLSVRGTVRYWGSASSSLPDVALIRLDGCPGRTLGWYDLDDARDGALAATPLAMPSVSQDRSMTRLSLQQGCRVHADVPQRGWLLHDCATRQGASGAPLIADLSGSPVVVGVNAGEFSPAPGMRGAYDPRHANWAVGGRWIMGSTRLRGMLERDRARDRPNPLLRTPS